MSTFERNSLGCRLPVGFCAVSDLEIKPRLYFGHASLDQFIGGLRPGQVVFFYGSRQCSTLSELLCVQVQLEARFGGFNSKAVFIDGGNTFDPYFLAQHVAERFPEVFDQALDGILVSRAFTCHQLTSFITRTLPEEIRKLEVKLIVVSDMINLYCDPDVDRRERLDTFKVSLNSLTSIAGFKQVVVLLTSLNEKVSRSYLRAVTDRVDVVARLEEVRDHSARIILEKHPTLPSRSSTIERSTSRFLENFLEVATDG